MQFFRAGSHGATYNRRSAAGRIAGDLVPLSGPDREVENEGSASAGLGRRRPSPNPDPSPAVAQFLDSMHIDYEKWHDGIGYDLSALDRMVQAERDEIAEMLIRSGSKTWRDLEALDHIGTPKARAAINAALKDPSSEVRIAASRYSREIGAQREAVLVDALERSELFGGLGQALDQVQEFHPPSIVDALLRGALRREGEVAVHFAAMLYYIHGKADVPFDWNQRPFFLRFHTADRWERAAAFRELCKAIGVDASKYL